MREFRVMFTDRDSRNKYYNTYVGTVEDVTDIIKDVLMTCRWLESGVIIGWKKAR